MTPETIRNPRTRPVTATTATFPGLEIQVVRIKGALAGLSP